MSKCVMSVTSISRHVMYSGGPPGAVQCWHISPWRALERRQGKIRFETFEKSRKARFQNGRKTEDVRNFLKLWQVFLGRNDQVVNSFKWEATAHQEESPQEKHKKVIDNKKELKNIHLGWGFARLHFVFYVYVRASCFEALACIESIYKLKYHWLYPFLLLCLVFCDVLWAGKSCKSVSPSIEVLNMSPRVSFVRVRIDGRNGLFWPRPCGCWAFCSSTREGTPVEGNSTQHDVASLFL